MKRACLVTSLVEELDGVELMDEERILVSFLSTNINMITDRVPAASTSCPSLGSTGIPQLRAGIMM